MVRASLLLVVVLLGLAGCAGGGTSGPYVSGAGGANWREDARLGR
ncbi:hypothetical protein [Roseomonas acroporae]|nr:hypothetical protein [Roseomonas acroporae]